MKTLKISLLVLMMASVATSCRKDKTEDNPNPTTEVPSNLETKTVNDLAVTAYSKFSFKKGELVTGNDWDIAFNTTTILVNGGEKFSDNPAEPGKTGIAAAYIANGTLDSVSSVDESKLKQDGSNYLAIPKGSGNGWYNYNPTTHSIDPIPNKVLVFRTHDGKYAKMVITKYDYDDYQTADREYSFKYVYQGNGTKKF